MWSTVFKLLCCRCSRKLLHQSSRRHFKPTVSNIRLEQALYFTIHLPLGCVCLTSVILAKLCSADVCNVPIPPHAHVLSLFFFTHNSACKSIREADMVSSGVKSTQDERLFKHSWMRCQLAVLYLRLITELPESQWVVDPDVNHWLWDRKVEHKTNICLLLQPYNRFTTAVDSWHSFFICVTRVPLVKWDSLTGFAHSLIQKGLHDFAKHSCCL